jgi:hypothetical protein
VRNVAVFGKEIGEPARGVMVHVLENENALHACFGDLPVIDGGLAVLRQRRVAAEGYMANSSVISGMAER